MAEPEKETLHSYAEKQLLHMIRELKYGEIRVIVQDGKPVRAEEIKKSVVLGQDENK
ncbi:MAG: YezD family protein [Oscillospiraceae bacterium]|jgi:hypothetical protein|nr:YezD family protein [Oscillospiraceae bacterium]